MAFNAGANVLEKAIGHDTSKIDPHAKVDVSNPANDPAKLANDSGETMKALVWQGKNKVDVVDVPIPALLDPNDIIVRVTGTTVCGSDLHLLHGQIVQIKPGDILGHEFVGIVESVGSGITTLKPGDRVVNSFVVSCGQCDFCKRNLTTACEKTNASELQKEMYGSRMGGIFGYSHFVGGYAGGQAEYVRVPFGQQNLLKLPDDVPDEKGLYLSDVLVTSYNAVERTGVQPGDTVAIWGLGPIGLFSAIWAFQRGASRVLGIDNNWRCAWAAKKIPGLEPIDYTQLPKSTSVTKSSVVEEIHRLVPGGVDCSIEASGSEYAKSWMHWFELQVGMEQDSSEIVNEAIMSTKKFGRVGIIADYVGYTNHFNIGSLMERGVSLIGCGQTPVQKYWPTVLQAVREGKVDPTVILTHRIKMEDVAKGYYWHDQKKDGVVKFYVETKFSGPRLEGTPEVKSLD